MNNPSITNAAVYPSYISYAAGAFTLTPLSGDTGPFIFLITLIDQSNSSLTVDFYFQIKINENQPPYFISPLGGPFGLSPSSVSTTTLPYFFDGEHDSITLTILSMPSFATFDLTTRTFTFNPITLLLVGTTYTV